MPTFTHQHRGQRILSILPNKYRSYLLSYWAVSIHFVTSQHAQHIYQLADWQLQLCVPPSQVSVQHCWLVYNGQHNYNHNVFSSTEGVFTNVWIDADEVGGQGDDDPEELLAHADDAADPGEEGQGGDVELRPRLLHLTVEVNEQAVSVLTRAAKDPSVFTITEKAPTMSSPGSKSLLTY